MADNKQDSQPVLPTRGVMRQLSRYSDGYGGGAARGGPRSPYPNWNPAIQRARVTVAIPSGSESSPSSTGKVKLKIKAADGSWGDSDEFQVFNDHTYSSDVPVGRMIKVAWIAGEWWVVSGSCS